MKQDFLKQYLEKTAENQALQVEIHQLNEKAEELDILVAKRGTALHSQNAINKALKYKIEQLETGRSDETARGK